MSLDAPSSYADRGIFNALLFSPGGHVGLASSFADCPFVFFSLLAGKLAAKIFGTYP